LQDLRISQQQFKLWYHITMCR